MCYDWPVKNAIVNLLIRLEGNLKCISSNLFSSLGIGTALQALLRGCLHDSGATFTPE